MPNPEDVPLPDPRLGEDPQLVFGLQRQPQNAQLTFPTSIQYYEPKKGTWRCWMMRLEETFDFFGITEEENKKRMLSHYMGFEAYNKLCDRIAPKVPRNLTYTQMGKELQDCFDPEPLEIVEVFRFLKREQQAGETCDDYLAALRKIAVNCNFGCDFLEKALRNQFVVGLRNKATQERLLEKRDLTLEVAVAIAKALETSL